MDKKENKTEGVYLDRSLDKNKFPVGFEYIMGSNTYKVVGIEESDPNTEMRRVSVSDGSTEIIEVRSIEKDLKEPDARVIFDPANKDIQK